MKALLRPLLAAAALVVLAGCASVPAGSSTPGAGTQTGTAAPGNPADPWEAWNRKVYAFNDALDLAIVKPVATAYRDVVPQLVRTGVSNFFGNISDIWSAANHLLQGKVGSGLDMGFRVMTNTLVGLGGVFDPATELGMPRRREDFGQTLGVWGMGPGPFVMLPLLGPSTLRDSAGLVADRQISASDLASHSARAVAVTALEVIDLRTSLLSSSSLLDSVALDRYSFLRDAYLQRRLDQVYDGAAPMIDEFADEPASPPAGAKPGEPKAVPAVQPAKPAAPAPAVSPPGVSPVTPRAAPPSPPTPPTSPGPK